MPTESSFAPLLDNPFALLVDPGAVLAAHAHSRSLSGVPRHVHHGLDRKQFQADSELARFDAAVDAGRRAPRPRS